MEDWREEIWERANLFAAESGRSLIESEWGHSTGHSTLVDKYNVPFCDFPFCDFRGWNSRDRNWRTE